MIISFDDYILIARSDYPKHMQFPALSHDTVDHTNQAY